MVAGRSKERKLSSVSELKCSLALGKIEKNANELISCHLLGIAKALRKYNVSKLSLFQTQADLRRRILENRKFSFLASRHSETLLTFSRALACTISAGYLQELELGFALWDRDLKILAAGLLKHQLSQKILRQTQIPIAHKNQSRMLKKLSFANSELGDHGLQILGKSLQECAYLQILCLSACALTDDAATLISAILKAHVCRQTQQDWQASLRSSNDMNTLPTRWKGLVALDISQNSLTDVATQRICNVLKVGTPLEALNLRGNQLTRLSGKLILEVMKERGILHFVDLRDNRDSHLMCVLEDGRHLTTFSQMHPLFWKSIYVKKLKCGSMKSADNQESLCRKITKRHHTQSFRSASFIPSPCFPQRTAYWKAGVVFTPSIARAPNSGKGACRQLVPGHSKYEETSQRDRKQSPSSCSTSSYFAAWEYDDSSAKENEPYQSSSPLDEDIHDDALPRWMGKQIKHDVPQLDTYYCDHHMTTRKLSLQPLVYLTSKNSGYKDGLTVQRSYGLKCKQESVQKRKQPSSGIQQSEWNPFLKEITRALLRLQERLDELIGPDDPDSLAKQASSQLQVLC